MPNVTEEKTRVLKELEPLELLLHLRNGIVDQMFQGEQNVNAAGTLTIVNLVLDKLNNE